jgi:hypothetical protein
VFAFIRGSISLLLLDETFSLSPDLRPSAQSAAKF